MNDDGSLALSLSQTKKRKRNEKTLRNGGRNKVGGSKMCNPHLNQRSDGPRRNPMGLSLGLGLGLGLGLLINIFEFWKTRKGFLHCEIAIYLIIIHHTY